MSVAPLPVRRRLGYRRPLPAVRMRAVAPRALRRLARRKVMVAIAKRLLPLAALALLSALALWPEFGQEADRARLAYRRGIAVSESGTMTRANYHGVDASGRPYTVTAAVARQVDAERVNLTEPQGDLTLESGSWLMAQSRQGVYLQRAGSLDLSGDVQLYRDDGTTLATTSATLDLKAGAAVGAEMVHSEGPFGTLDAQGFAVIDRGAVMQFPGPGRLVLSGAQGRAAAAVPAPVPGRPPAAPRLAPP